MLMPESCEFEFKADWPNSKDHLHIAAIVGHTTSTTSRLWFRAGKPGKYCVLYFDGENKNSCKWFEQHKKLGWDEDTIAAAKKKGILAKPEKDGIQVDCNTDTTFVVDICSLTEGCFYRYALYSIEDERIILGHESESERDYGFRTPSSGPGKFSFGLYSCHMPFRKGRRDTEIINMDMWEHLYTTLTEHSENDNKIDFLIAGGDQVYVDGVDALSIWQHLNDVMCKKEKGEILPDIEIMKSWYRKIYRGYWGFDAVRRVFSSFPTYMTWDDHEICDGWGSRCLVNDSKNLKEKNDLHKILPNLAKKGFNEDEGQELIDRMKTAAFKVYDEYQHSHNNKKEGQHDYSFTHKECAEFYVLDVRGHRNISSFSHKILGKNQMNRFENHVKNLNDNIKFLFVVSAVPVYYACSLAIEKGHKFRDELGDDLRDQWEWDGHKEERRALMDILFKAAKRGIKVCILSGDVHVSAAFELTDGKYKIYQLISSAITYNYNRLFSFLRNGLGLFVLRDGETEEEYIYERLELSESKKQALYEREEDLYEDPCYVLLKVNPKEETVCFRLYGKDSVFNKELTW